MISFRCIEKTKNPINCKIQIKDLKNSKVYNNVMKEIENKKKEKAERLEDGEITDSDMKRMKIEHQH